jgi:MFS family permease
MMSIGYPIGGMIAGAVTATMLAAHGWVSIFFVGFVLALIVAPIVVLYLPESMSFLLERRPKRALERINETLALYGHSPLATLPPVETKPLAPYAGLFKGDQRRATLVVATVSLLTFLTIYFFLSWQPKMLVDIGFSATGAAKAAGASSFCGAVGCALFGLISRRIPGRRLAQISIFFLGASVICFGILPPIIPAILSAAMVAGLSVAASTVGLHVVIADAFPPAYRSTGAGFAIGIGRIGSALGPAIAGGLFSKGLMRGEVAGALGLSAIAACLILILVHRRSAADTIAVGNGS